MKAEPPASFVAPANGSKRVRAAAAWTSLACRHEISNGSVPSCSSRTSKSTKFRKEESECAASFLLLQHRSRCTAVARRITLGSSALPNPQSDDREAAPARRDGARERRRPLGE